MKYEITSNQMDQLISLHDDMHGVAMDAIDSKYSATHWKAMLAIAIDLKALLQRIETQDVEA